MWKFPKMKKKWNELKLENLRINREIETENNVIKNRKFGHKNKKYDGFFKNSSFFIKRAHQIEKIQKCS